MASQTSDRECVVCLGPHDESIHVATVRLHAWWRESILERIDATAPCEAQARDCEWTTVPIP